MQYINVKPQTGRASSLLFSYTIFYEKFLKSQMFRPTAKADAYADLTMT